jgi:hypothetical protein
MASAERDRAYKWASGGCAPSGGYDPSGVQDKAPGQRVKPPWADEFLANETHILQWNL